MTTLRVGIRRILFALTFRGLKNKVLPFDGHARILFALTFRGLKNRSGFRPFGLFILFALTFRGLKNLRSSNIASYSQFYLP